MRYIVVLLAIVAVCAKLEFVELDGAIQDVNCLKAETKVVLVRGYLAIGKVDPDMPENIKKLVSVNLPCSAYMVPCFSCGDPRKQARELIAAMPLPNRRFFIHVITGQWSSDLEQNRAFLRELVDEFKKSSTDAGIVTNEFYFNKILGPDFSEFSELMLIYIHADNTENCNEYTAFGDWDMPFGKKYDFENPLCNLNADLVTICRYRQAPVQSIVSTQ
jgi:hypothetical protein